MIRASSRSARAGTFASIACATGVLELGVLDAQPVGVGGDHRQRRLPSAWTRTPVRIGRTSSRDAARATSSIVSPAARPAACRLALELRQARKVLGRQGAQVKPRAAGGELDVALLGAQLERDLALGQAADDVDEQAAGSSTVPSRSTLTSVERLRQRQLHVGGAQRQLAVAGDQQDAAERRQRAAGRHGAADELQGGEERVA